MILMETKIFFNTSECGGCLKNSVRDKIREMIFYEIGPSIAGLRPPPFISLVAIKF